MVTVMTREEWEKSYSKRYKAKLRKQRKAKATNCLFGLTLVAFVVFGIMMLGYAGNADYYAETGRVNANGTYFIMDGYKGICTNDGQFLDANRFDFKNGDKVRVEIDTQYTTETGDDEVVSVYRRWF